MQHISGQLVFACSAADVSHVQLQLLCTCGAANVTHQPQKSCLKPSDVSMYSAKLVGVPSVWTNTTSDRSPSWLATSPQVTKVRGLAYLHEGEMQEVGSQLDGSWSTVDCHWVSMP